MNDYRSLGLEKDPFSTSPDPAFLYQAKGHKAALYRLLVALPLKRGLSLVLGDVGTGKTTLSRRLCQIVSREPDYDFHMILNPVFRSETEFLAKLAELLRLDLPNTGTSAAQYLGAIEKNLLRRGVEEGRTVVLLIDEAQKLDLPCLEVLRTLLNYETNEHKLLQLILVSQLEILPKIVRFKNFWDRISLKCVLRPLNRPEMKEMIEFRLRDAGYQARKSFFPHHALRTIYRHAGGSPRRATVLCHNILERLARDDRESVSREVVRKAVAE